MPPHHMKASYMTGALCSNVSTVSAVCLWTKIFMCLCHKIKCVKTSKQKCVESRAVFEYNILLIYINLLEFLLQCMFYFFWWDCLMYVCDMQRILVWENPALYTGLFTMPSGQQWKAQLGQFFVQVYLCWRKQCSAVECLWLYPAL